MSNGKKRKPVFKTSTLTKHLSDEEFVTVRAMNQEELSRYSSLVEKQFVRNVKNEDGTSEEVTEIVRDFWGSTAFLLKHGVIDFTIKDDEGDMFTFDPSDLGWNVEVIKSLPTARFLDVLRACNDANGLTPEAVQKLEEVEKN